MAERRLLPSERICMTIDEAAEYSLIGQNKLRDIIRENPDLDFVLHKDSHTLIKRVLFEDWVTQLHYI
ncbi:MAG: transposase [Clostridiales bacterium]|nr:transposase [Clostridiales bacterium]